MHTNTNKQNEKGKTQTFYLAGTLWRQSPYHTEASSEESF